MSQPLATVLTNTDPNSCVTACTPRTGKPWQATNQCLTFLAVWESGVLNGINFRHRHVTEGMILQVYPDNVGLPTVGCGHLIVPEDHLHLGDTISLTRARDLFRRDLRRIEHAVKTKVNVPLFQHEYDALVSIVFNCGPGQGADGIAQQVNSGDYDGTPDFILSYRSDSHHHARRVTEANLFSHGIYDASH
ncbi:lysozyme [Paraburkholderia sp. RAU2J]|nr:lysozyme [Paraburkholderia sp. RAU2J]